MAYQARGRDPLFDSDMATALERRGKELAGLALIVLGLMAAAMIGSYTPEDPSWLVATDAPVQNWMGRFGAAFAAPLFMIVGAGSWAIAVVLVVWGARLVLHAGEERAMSRVIFAPIWIAVASIYAAGLTAGPEWSHSFGLGGLFGDMAMGTLMGILPLGAGLSLKVAMVLMGAGVIAFGAFVLGFTKAELQNIARFLGVGAVVTYVACLRVLSRVAGHGAAGAVRGAQAVQAAHTARRERRRVEAEEAAEWEAAQAAVPAPSSRVRRAVPAAPEFHDLHVEDGDDDVLDPYDYADAAPAPERGGFLSRMPSLIRRQDPMPEPELVEQGVMSDEIDPPGEDRVRAKIADAIRARLRATPEARIAAETPLTKGRGRRPAPLIADTRRRSALPPEPPLTAAHARA
ncbi:DNA translocase FtsK 4TM domain-containing protein, partial [Roseivivax isoporae]